MGQEYALGEAEREVGAHLVETLQRRGARPRDFARVAGRGEIAEAQARIIVARPDDPVEINFAQAHLATVTTLSPTSTSSSSAASRSMQIPFLGTRLTAAQAARKCLRRPAATSILSEPASPLSPIVCPTAARLARSSWAE